MKRVREYINEKFEPESDPIKDLGIGLRDFWKKEYEKFKKTSPWGTFRTYFDLNHANHWRMFVDILLYIIFSASEGKSVQNSFDYACNLYHITCRPNDSQEDCELFQDFRKEIAKVLKDNFHIEIDAHLDESLNEKFEEQDSDPIADLGIGGFNLSEEIYHLIGKFELMNIHNVVVEPEAQKYWKETLENALLDRQVTGIFAKGNEDSWGAFHKLTTPKVKRIHLFVDDPPLTTDNMAVLDFALIVDDPGAWVKFPFKRDFDEVLQNPDETWYYFSFGDIGKLKGYTPKQKYTLHLA